MSSKKALIVCVGNSLVGDDAAGCAVHQLLSRKALPAGTRLLLLGIGGLTLLENLAAEEVLMVVDAVQLGAAPGTIHVLNWDELPQTEAGVVTAHGIGLREAIALGRILSPDVMPRKVMLIGIEGISFETIGSGMTPEVAAAIEAAAQEVCRQLALLLTD